MDSSLVAAIVTSICTAGCNASVAITALVLSDKGIGRLESAVDRLEARLDRTSFPGTDSLVRAVRAVDKRLAMIEDRLKR
jgi:hypothetical protein